MQDFLRIKMTALSLVAVSMFMLISCAENGKLKNEQQSDVVLDTDIEQTFSNAWSAAGGARIIGLGEQTHGAGTVFHFKVEYMKWLHQRHGVNVFALESGMFDVYKLVERMKKGETLRDIAPGNIFYMYSKSEEVKALFDYVEASQATDSPVTLVGFDSQHTGETSLNQLVDELKQVVDSSLVWGDQENWYLIQNILENKAFSNLEKTQVMSALEAMSQSLSGDKNGFWQRIVSGLIAQANRQWQQGDKRSFEMGRNLGWIAQQYGTSKIVVWAHSAHLMKKGYQGTNAGEYLAQTFGDQYHMLHFSALSGSFINFISMETQSVSTLVDGSIEHKLSQQGSFEQHHVNLNDLEPWRNLSIWAVDYKTTVQQEQWQGLYDAAVVFKEVSPANYSD